MWAGVGWGVHRRGCHRGGSKASPAGSTSARQQLLLRALTVLLGTGTLAPAPPRPPRGGGRPVAAGAAAASTATVGVALRRPSPRRRQRGRTMTVAAGMFGGAGAGTGMALGRTPGRIGVSYFSSIVFAHSVQRRSTPCKSVSRGKVIKQNRRKDS